MHWYKNKDVGYVIISEKPISPKNLQKDNLVEISKQEYEKREIWSLTDEWYEKLNPPQESMETITKNKIDYIRLLDDPKWLHMGYVPMPKTKFEIFRHHLLHGIMMNYPLGKVILYSIMNTSKKLVC